MAANKYVTFFVLIVILTMLVVTGSYLFTSGSLTLPFSSQKSEPNKIVAEGTVVSDFPDFPVYPNATVVNSYKKGEEGKTGYEMKLMSSDAPNVVMEWYLDELQNTGWTITNYPETLEAQEIFLEAQNSNRKVVVNVETEDDATEIVVEFPY